MNAGHPQDQLYREAIQLKQTEIQELEKEIKKREEVISSSRDLIRKNRDEITQSEDKIDLKYTGISNQKKKLVQLKSVEQDTPVSNDRFRERVLDRRGTSTRTRKKSS